MPGGALSLLLFGNQGPSLSLNFLSGALDPRVTFTRTGAVATYFDATGTLQNATANVPRFDYNPATLAINGLLIEESRVNSITYSVPQADTTHNWFYVAGNTTGTVNAAVAPDGTTTALSLVETVSSSAHFAQNNSVSYTSGTAYTISVFVKPNTATAIQIAMGTGAFTLNAWADFNLSNGTVGTVGSDATAKIQALSNGWYRVSITATANATSGANIILALTNNNASATRVPSYVGSGQSLYLWGAQSEAGAFATSVIPTSSVAVTRGADVASIATTAFGFNPNAGTFISQQIIPVLPVTQNAEVLGLGVDGSNDFRTFFPGGGVGASTNSFVTSTQGGVASAATAVAGTPFSVGATYNRGTLLNSISQGGAAVQSSTLTGLPAMTTMFIGSPGRSAQINGALRFVKYFPRVLPPGELQGNTR